MTESESSNTYIAGYEHSFFPSRPGLCVLGMLEASQVPWVDVRTCMGSWTPRSLSALTNTDGLVLPSTTGTVSALRKSAISSLISPAHAHRYRRFAHPLAGTDARLAAKVARYTFLSAGLAPAVHARVSLAHIAVGTLVSQRPPHRSGRARQGIRLLPSVRRPSELSPHKRRLAHRRGREASCDTLTWRSVQYVLRIPFLPLAPVLPSTDSAEVATPLCSPASTVL